MCYKHEKPTFFVIFVTDFYTNILVFACRGKLSNKDFSIRYTQFVGPTLQAVSQAWLKINIHASILFHLSNSGSRRVCSRSQVP